MQARTWRHTDTGSPGILRSGQGHQSIDAGLASGDAIRLGDALNGNAPLSESDSEITACKAMGIAMEDLIAAEIVYHKALEETAVTIIKS